MCETCQGNLIAVDEIENSITEKLEYEALVDC